MADKTRDRRTPGEGAKEEDREIEHVVCINRVAAVVKGGRRFSFSAAVVVGNGDGEVGMGYGKAREVPGAVAKAREEARRSMEKIVRKGTTVPYAVVGRFCRSRIILAPAAKGTGTIASGPVRAVLEAAGIKDILTKSLGNNNKVNVMKATLNGLEQLRSKEDFEKLRNVKIEL